MGMRGHKYTNKAMEMLAVSKKAFSRAIKSGFGLQSLDVTDYYRYFKKQDPTQAQIDRLRNRIDQVKNGFEKRFKAIFNKWQARVIKDFAQQIKKGASIVVVGPEQKAELNKILINHWQEVSKTFIPGTEYIRIKAVIEQPVDGPGDTENDNETDLFIEEVLNSIEQDVQDTIIVNLPFHTGKIIESTEQIGNSARSEAFEDGEQSAASIMKTRMAGRSTTVSVTETQWIAEESDAIAIGVTTPVMLTATEKQLKALQPVSPNVRLKTTNIDELFEIGTVHEVDLFRRQLTNPQKMWVTMGDKRVRSSHNMVEGVIVALHEAFRLVGGLLLFPADSSLGASFSEIIGCRCHCIYF